MNTAANTAPVLIMAGGTGGHVFPGLALAEEFRSRGVPVVWLGTRGGLESTLVPEAGFAIEWLQVSGLRGKGVFRLLQAPLMVARALSQAVAVMRRLRPRLAIGMGGFVSGPGGVAARLSGVPVMIHEQNSVAGFTNRILAKLALVIFEAFPGSFPASPKVRFVGNPVRTAIEALPPPAERMAGRRGTMRLLVVGGSQGARALNRTVPAALAELNGADRPSVWHQAGEGAVDGLRQAYTAIGLQARVEAFIPDMAEAYGWADLVVCRAGALTVSELAAVGIGAILVPYPHAVDDHQTVNARFLTEAGAACLLPEQQLDARSLATKLNALLGNRWRLETMAEAARALARPGAALTMADEGMRRAR